MKANKLKGKLVEKGMNVETLAKLIGVDKSTLYRKLNDFDTFTLGDVTKIAKVMGLSNKEAYELFIA